MRFFLRVLLTERHCAQRDFTNLEVGVAELPVLQRCLLVELGGDDGGWFERAPPPPEASCGGSGSSGRAR